MRFGKRSRRYGGGRVCFPGSLPRARAYGIGDAHCGESVHPWLRVLGWGFRRVPPSRARDLSLHLFGRTWLLIRRSLVRAQIEEPKILLKTTP